MTKKDWLAIVTVVRGNWKDFCDDEQSFNTFYESLGEFDQEEVAEAARRLINEYAYKPNVANFRIKIEVIREEREAKVKREKTIQEQKERAEQPQGDDYGWIRFTQWMLETDQKYPPDRAGLLRLKVEFEREHPDWTPRRRRPEKRGGGMEKIGRIVQDALAKQNPDREE